MRMASMTLRIVCIGPPEVWPPWHALTSGRCGPELLRHGGCCTILKRWPWGKWARCAARQKPQRSTYGNRMHVNLSGAEFPWQESNLRFTSVRRALCH